MWLQSHLWWSYWKWSRTHAQPEVTWPAVTGRHGSDHARMHNRYILYYSSSTKCVIAHDWKLGFPPFFRVFWPQMTLPVGGFPQVRARITGSRGFLPIRVFSPYFFQIFFSSFFPFLYMFSFFFFLIFFLSFFLKKILKFFITSHK